MPRPVNPATAYRFVAHSTHGHVYASVQCTVPGKDGKNVRRHRHYGVLEGNKFTPWAEFLALPGSERAKFVFPPEWDLSLLDKLSDRRGRGRPVLDGDAQNRLYGDIWLLEQIAEKTKIRRDLEVVFEGNKEMADAVMTLAMFPYLTKFSFSRVERWQRNVKSPCDFPLSPKTIAKLTQSITEKHRMELLSLRSPASERTNFAPSTPPPEAPAAIPWPTFTGGRTRSIFPWSRSFPSWSTRFPATCRSTTAPFPETCRIPGVWTSS